MHKKIKLSISKLLLCAFVMVSITSCSTKTGNADETSAAAGKEETVMTEQHKKTEILPIRDISSVELVSEIKIGWNLGNTLDATKARNNLEPNAYSETAWGNPKTTSDMIRTVKEKGFNIVRLPVTWGGHMGEAPDYVVDEVWMERVAEVVGYVLDNDMFCILNTHHEDWYYPTYEKEKESKEQLAALWKQIAERFKGYDEKLIFEGLNEPRMRNTALEWNGGNEEGWDVVNTLNAVFVETVRASGGNNSLRHLMLPSYAASSESKAQKALKLPENDDKIIVSVHAYIPYNMALAEGGRGQWLPNKSASTDVIDNLFKALKETFTDKGIAVIMGEMGARDKNNLAYRVLWADYFFGRSREYGIPCLWWDNGAFQGSGELFGLLNRRELKWAYPEITDAMINAANAGKPLLTDITDIEQLGLSAG